MSHASKPDMKNGPLASKHPWIYVYAVCTMLAVIVNMVRMPRLSTSSLLTTVPIFAVVMTYIVFSSSRKAVRLVVTFLLALQVLGLPPIIAHHDYLGIASAIFFVSFGAFLLRQIPRDKRSGREAGRRSPGRHTKGDKEDDWDLP